MVRRGKDSYVTQKVICEGKMQLMEINWTVQRDATK